MSDISKETLKKEIAGKYAIFIYVFENCSHFIVFCFSTHDEVSIRVIIFLVLGVCVSFGILARYFSRAVTVYTFSKRFTANHDRRPSARIS